MFTHAHTCVRTCVRTYVYTLAAQSRKKWGTSFCVGSKMVGREFFTLIILPVLCASRERAKVISGPTPLKFIIFKLELK